MDPVERLDEAMASGLYDELIRLRARVAELEAMERRAREALASQAGDQVAQRYRHWTARYILGEA